MLLDTIEFSRGTAVIRYVASYATLAVGTVSYSAYEFSIEEPDFAVDSVPQMIVTLPNASDSIRNWLETYLNLGSVMATFRRYQDGIAVKTVSFPVIDGRFEADSIVITAEPVNINDLRLHKLQYTVTQFPGLTA